MLKVKEDYLHIKQIRMPTVAEWRRCRHSPSPPAVTDNR
jgi:hypothetical protein